MDWVPPIFENPCCSPPYWSFIAHPCSSSHPISTARVQPLYGAGRKENSGTGLHPPHFASSFCFYPLISISSPESHWYTGLKLLSFTSGSFRPRDQKKTRMHWSRSFSCSWLISKRLRRRLTSIATNVQRVLPRILYLVDFRNFGAHMPSRRSSPDQGLPLKGKGRKENLGMSLRRWMPWMFTGKSWLVYFEVVYMKKKHNSSFVDSAGCIFTKICELSTAWTAKSH